MNGATLYPGLETIKMTGRDLCHARHGRGQEKWIASSVPTRGPPLRTHLSLPKLVVPDNHIDLPQIFPSQPGRDASTRPLRPKYQVFVSSTFVDLRDERESVTWEILKAGHIPVGMENFSSHDDRGWKVIDKTLRTTDYYVLIIAGRYGSIDDSVNMSWTEREYRRAVELQIPILTFERQAAFITGDQVDKDDRSKRLEALIADVGSKRLRELWTTKDDLRARVGAALYKIIREDEEDGALRPGWYRGDQLPSRATLEEVTRLSAENRELRDQLETFVSAQTLGKDWLVKDAQVNISPIRVDRFELDPSMAYQAIVLEADSLGVVLQMRQMYYGKLSRGQGVLQMNPAGETVLHKVRIPWTSVEHAYPDAENGSQIRLHLLKALSFDPDRQSWILH